MPSDVESFDPYYKWLGIPTDEQPPHHYRLLAIRLFESDPDVIEQAADQRMAHVRSKQTGKNASLSQRLLNEIAAAKTELLNPALKKQYDNQLQQRLGAQQALTQAPSLFDALDPAFPAAPSIKLPTGPQGSGSVRKTDAGPLIAAAVGVGLLLLGIVVIVANSMKRPSVAARPDSSSVPNRATVPASVPPTNSSTPKGAPPPVVPEPTTATTANQDSASSMPAAAEIQPKQNYRLPVHTPTPDNSSSQSRGDSDPVPTVAAVVPEPVPEPSKEPRLPSENQRQPIPSESELDAARKTVKDIYAADFTVAKTAEQKTQLAARILRQANETRNDFPGKYALLDSARRIYEQLGELEPALRTCEQIEEEFEIEALALKENAIQSCARLAKRTGDWQAIGQAYVELMNAAIAADKWTLAQRASGQAIEYARKSRDKDLIQFAVSRSKDIAPLAAAYAEAQGALTRLVDDPNNSTDHLAAGRYLCFAKGNWEQGLVHLARGGDTDLAKLAEREKGGAASADELVLLGDDWLEFSREDKSLKTFEKLAMEERAVHWYQQALPSLSGLAKLRVDKLLKELSPEETVTPVLATPKPGRWIKFAGRWKVTYASGAVRNYEIDQHGSVRFVEVDRTASLAEREKDIVLDFNDGKLERVAITPQGLVVDHFDPASRYPESPKLKGHGVRTGAAKP